ncbi:MAG: 1-acyl-sn-glycerol-3-phosphate acyltransferase [Methylococcaceae bacterium]|nr:1-acyl-sn-glycerol-3-phosphate acyltransferase [Methylococcaceae bacterium]
MTQQNSSSQKNNFRVYLGSSIFIIYIFISVLVFGPLIILCLIFPFPVRYKLSTLWAASVLWVIKVCCGLTYKIEGLENLPKDQAYIVLSKHQSAWETLALRLFLPKQVCVLKQSLTWIPIGGWALSTLKPIAINRDNQRAALNTLIKQGTERLNEGFVVVIFPEGTRAAPGENKKFNAGGAMLAHRSGYPVIPLAHNAGEFWPRYSFLKYPGTITVKIGPAIESTEKKAKEINSAATEWIALAMNEISSPHTL